MLLEAMPLILFTTCSGMAAGAYVISALIESGREKIASEKAWLFPLVCLVLLGVGLLGTLLHLGQPLRFINGLSNPNSMISQEAYWSIAFGLILLVDVIITKKNGTSSQVLRILGALAAVGLMVVTSLAYYKSLGVPVWNTEATFAFFIVSDLVLGLALYLILGTERENRSLHVANVALCPAWLVALLAYAFHISNLGHDSSIMPVAVGAVLGPVIAGVISFMVLRKRMNATAAGWAILVFVLVGAVVTRFVFFTIGIP